MKRLCFNVRKCFYSKYIFGDNMDNFDPKKGTTTVALVGTDGVVMAADMRASMGYLIANKEAEKVNLIDDHMAMTIAGSVGDAQTLIRWMRAETNLYKMNNKKGMSIKSATTLLANILQGNKYYPFMVQLLLGGYDDDGPSVYSIDAIGGVTTEKFTSTGSGSPVAYGVLESQYKTGLTGFSKSLFKLPDLISPVINLKSNGFVIFQITRTIP